MLDHESQIAATVARKKAGVSSEGMERVYDVLKPLSDSHLQAMWREADPYTAHGALLRAQIAYVFEKRDKGQWLPH